MKKALKDITPQDLLDHNAIPQQWIESMGLDMASTKVISELMGWNPKANINKMIDLDHITLKV